MTEVQNKMEILEKENMELKKKLKELELHIKYMPFSEEYYKAQENFESNLSQFTEKL